MASPSASWADVGPRNGQSDEDYEGHRWSSEVEFDPEAVHAEEAAELFTEHTSEVMRIHVIGTTKTAEQKGGLAKQVTEKIFSHAGFPRQGKQNRGTTVPLAPKFSPVP